MYFCFRNRVLLVSLGKRNKNYSLRVYKTESSNLNSLVIQDDRNFNFVFPASETLLIKKTLKLPAGIAWENTGYFLKEYGLSNKEII